MTNVFVSSDELNRYAAQVRTMKGEMEQIFSQIRQRVNTMNARWDSPAGRSAYSRFESLSPVFDQYAALVENYALFLEQTASAYTENESLLQTTL